MDGIPGAAERWGIGKVQITDLFDGQAGPQGDGQADDPLDGPFFTDTLAAAGITCTL